MKLLLHMCCAPCSIYPASVLKEEGMEFEGVFYNPNIHPIEEFDQGRWENFKENGEKRCNMCYSTRLEKAAQFAAQNGFHAFTTTLLVSPYQKHDLIKEIGERFAQKYGLRFYYKDFRPGFRKGQQMAKEMGLYRQKYCGCIVSLRERQNKGGKV